MGASPLLLQKCIGLAEMPASEKSSVTQTADLDVAAVENQLLRIIQHCLFHLGRSSPEKICDGAVLFIQCLDSRIGKLLPSQFLCGNLPDGRGRSVPCSEAERPASPISSRQPLSGI